MLVMKQCLWCCRLDTGVVIIGNICILLSFLSIYHLSENFNHHELLTLNGIKSSTQACIEFVAAIIMLLVSFLLIIGAMKRQQKLIKLWLLVMAVYIVLISTAIVTAFFLPEVIILKDPIATGLFVSLFFLSYFWYCVHQFNEELGKHVDLVIYDEISLNKV